MKTSYFNKNWVIPLLGIAVAVGGITARTTYLGLERQTRSADVLQNMLDHLHQDQKLSLALKKIHDGDVTAAARQLDVLLCDDIIRLNSDLEWADGHTKTCVEDVFRRIARVRPPTPEKSSDSIATGEADALGAAQRILALAMSSEPKAH
jgi:hypothetical protein